MVKYEYGVVVRTTALKVTPEEMERMPEEEVGVGFTQALHTLVISFQNMLLTPEMKGWEAVSHNVSFYGFTMVVTFLIRKQKY